MSNTESAVPYKSSAEILSELFSSFNAVPPNVKEKVKKHKKSKKKHKHKDKKHKKKSKHKYSSDESSHESTSSETKHKHKSKKKSKETDTAYNNLIQWNLDFDLSRVKKEPTDDELKNDLIKHSIKTELTENVEIKSEQSDINRLSLTDLNKTSCNSSESNIESLEKLSNKIMIQNLKNSSAYETAIKEVEEKASKFEEGELTESDDSTDDDLINSFTDTTLLKSDTSSSKSDRKRKRSHRDKSRDSDKEKRSKKDNDDSKSKKHKDSDKYSHKSSSHKSEHRSRSKERDKKEKDKDRHTNRRERDYDHKTDHRHYDDYHYNNQRSYSTYDPKRDRERDRYKYDRIRRSRSRSKDRSRSKTSRERERERKRRSASPSSSIDKKKLLEIARKNAINMLKSGTLPEALTLGPQAQEKVIAAIKAGGKTIEELTDFCKNLSKKEELGELSSVSSNEDDDDKDDSETEKVFHHPFQLKEKPSSIVMNIKNATPLPVKTSKEKSAELRMQFPVSSGQLHRKNEGEWVPVSPKKAEAPLAIMPAPQPVAVPVPIPAPAPPKPVPPPLQQAPAFVKASTGPVTLNTVLPPPPPPPENLIASLNVPQPEMDISTIVSERLNAMRRLQENPNDVQALNQMYKVQKEMSAWAQSKQQPGQFTGSTGAQILTPAELSSGYQAWARKDQLQNAAPLTGGMGMHLLQKMGWKPGEGLGKEKTGSLEPLLLEVKLDKKGLVANEEVKGKKIPKAPKTQATVKTLAGKHPVSLLGEYATKRKLGAPQYECCFECGPDHKKNFLFKVILNGIEYKPNIASSTKKQAKADAATVCLQQLGILLS